MGFLSVARAGIASVSRSLTGRKRKVSEEEGEDALEPPVPQSASRPRLAGQQQQQQPQQQHPIHAPIDPVRLDFSSPAVNLAAAAPGRNQPAVRGAGAAAAARLPSRQLPSQPRQHGAPLPPAARRLDTSLTAAGSPATASGAVPSAVPFTKRFAPPTRKVASGTPRGFSPMLNPLLLSLRQVHEVPDSFGKTSFTPGMQQHRTGGGQQQLRQAQGTFTSSGGQSAQWGQQQPVRRQQPTAAWGMQQQPAAGRAMQRLPQQQRRDGDIELQPLGAAFRAGGRAFQEQDAALLKQGVSIHVRQEELRELQHQQQPTAPATVEEVDLTGEPSSSQQLPPALQHRQKWGQPGQAAGQAGGALLAPAAVREFDWRKMVRDVVAEQEPFDDISSDVNQPAHSRAEALYRQTVGEALQAKRKALQADQRQLQFAQQAHTALEQSQPMRAQVAELEARKLEQQLHDLQLQRKALAEQPQQKQQKQQKAPAVEMAAEEEQDDEEVVELLSSEEEEEEEEEPAPSASVAAVASEQEESEVSQQLERVALEEEGLALAIPDAWRDKYESVLAPGNPAEVLVDHPLSAIQLTRRDMACMASLQWLNDEVINLYISLLIERDAARRKQGKGPRCHFFSTFFANKLYKDTGYKYDQVRRWTLPKRLRASGQASDSILDVDRIVVPVHQGLHWVCAVIDLQHRKFVYYDSLKGEDHHCLERLAQYLRDEYSNKRSEERDDILAWPREFPKRIPQQHNGCDCGVFTLLFASHVGRGAPMAFSQAQIDDWRVRIVHELLTLRVD